MRVKAAERFDLGADLRRRLQSVKISLPLVRRQIGLRMFGDSQPQFADRTHFIAFASRVMRRILVDYARARKTAIRGGGDRRVGWDTAIEMEAGSSEYRVELTDLDLALEALSREHPQLGEVIEMQYFEGLTAEEIAAAVDRSAHVVRHELRFAQAWLRRKLGVTKQ